MPATLRRAVASSQVGDWLSDDIAVPAKAQGVVLPLDTSGKQGLFYWLGTSFGTGSFSNPSGSSITLTASTYDTPPISNTTDRADSDFYTTNASGSWWKVDIGGDNANRRLVPTDMSFRQRVGSGSNLLQAFVLEGSTDDSSWTTLATVNDGDLTESAGAWTHITLSSSGAYRYFRLTMTGGDTSGQNYLVISEIELYGTVSGD